MITPSSAFSSLLARVSCLPVLLSSALNSLLSFNTTIALLLATKQARQQEIKACESIADCNRVLHRRFDIHMPLAQMQDEGIVDEPTALDL
jgi:hypothetical protein